MRFTPKTQDELDREGLLEEGTYDFEVLEAIDTQSKKGNDMIALVLRIFLPSNAVYTQRDWLLEAMARKLAHFCKEVGLTGKYEDGSLAASDCLGRTGRVQLEIEEGKGGYGPKNTVRDYGEGPKSDKVPTATSSTSTASIADQDDIPFKSHDCPFC